MVFSFNQTIIKVGLLVKGKRSKYTSFHCYKTHIICIQNIHNINWISKLHIKVGFLLRQKYRNSLLKFTNNSKYALNQNIHKTLNFYFLNLYSNIYQHLCIYPMSNYQNMKFLHVSSVINNNITTFNFHFLYLPFSLSLFEIYVDLKNI